MRPSNALRDQGTVSVYALRDIPRGTIIDENEDNIDTSYPGFAPVKINLGELPESTRSFVLATYHASANVNDTSDHAHEGGHGNNGKHCEERLVRKRKKMKIEKKKAAPSFSLMSSEPEASTVIVLPCYGLAGLIRPLSYVRRTQSGGGGGGGGGGNQNITYEANCILVDSKKTVRRSSRKRHRASSSAPFSPSSSSSSSSSPVKHLCAKRDIKKGEELIVAAGETMFSTNAVLRARTPSLRFSSARSKKLENQLKNGLPWSLGATRYGVGAFAIKKLPKGFVVDTFLSKVDTTARKVDLSWEQIKAYGVPKEVQSRVQTLSVLMTLRTLEIHNAHNQPTNA